MTGFVAAFTEGPIDFYKSQVQVQIIRTQSDPNYKRAPCQVSALLAAFLCAAGQPAVLFAADQQQDQLAAVACAAASFKDALAPLSERPQLQACALPGPCPAAGVPGARVCRIYLAAARVRAQLHLC